MRWHLSGIPTTVDLRTFRLEVAGRVRKHLSLSLTDLQTKFEHVSLVALCQCAGNSRSLFEPRVPGGQWGAGAMGNARWKGVRLKDLLDAAGVLPGAIQVGLRGLDVPATAKTPPFEKSLQIDHARDGEVMIAYEMNDEPLPMLNGFPIRIVVPGWYATYWVKALSSITVLDQLLKTFWMDKAYRIPGNTGANEDPQRLSPVTVPISTMAVHSIFVRPAPDEQLRVGQKYELAALPTTVTPEFDGSKYRTTAGRPGATPLSARTWGSTPGGAGERNGRRLRKVHTTCWSARPMVLGRRKPPPSGIAAAISET